MNYRAAIYRLLLPLWVAWAVPSLQVSGQEFRRGDVNLDALIDLSDAVAILDHLFLSGEALPCRDAADVDDSGTILITDPVALLSALFLGGPRPPGSTECAADPSADELDCRDEGPCADAPVPRARVVDVAVSGGEGSYTFSVTVESPDTGCEQFADWWEVISPEGDLIARRILLHSHVDEQPFTRSTGGVAITADQEVIVRAHMNTSGYGMEALRGSNKAGFSEVLLEEGFAAELELEEPQPTGCAF